MFNLSWRLEWEREALLGLSMMVFALLLAIAMTVIAVRAAP